MSKKCHGSPPPAAAGRSGLAMLETGSEALRVLLVGGPNVGKSTLFNALTGARQRTTNAPGTTVELATGTWRTPAADPRDPDREWTIVDLPGTYSLLARSADEQVSADAVVDLARTSEKSVGRTGACGVAVVVLDATALIRSLYLVAQVAETGVPLVVALTMLDLAAATADSPTSAVEPASLAATLAAVLGVPVVPVDARHRDQGGLPELAQAVAEVAKNPRPLTGIAPLTPPCECTTPSSERTSSGLASSELAASALTSSALGASPLTASTECKPMPDYRRRLAGADTDLAAELAHAETLFAWVEQALENFSALLTAPSNDPHSPRVEPPQQAPSAGSSARLSAGSSPLSSSGPPSEAMHMSPPGPLRRTFSDRVDTVLLNPWAGIPVFLAVVWLLFELTTRFAAPVQDLIDRLVNGQLASGITWLLGLVGLQDGWVQGLLIDGLLAGVGTVLTFLPVMAVMFAALGVLEDCGYLARAAFVADRAMRAIGLDGRALLPLIVGFGCNLPAFAATRTLPNARQRLLTGLLIPLTSCSARLTVYVLLAGTFFAGRAGTVIFGMYVASVLLVLAGGLILRRTAFRDVRAEPLILVLPPYQRPHLRTLGMSVRMRVGAFVLGAGKIIVATMLVVWVLMAVPVAGQHAIGDVPVADSLYGRAASSIAPVLAPAGFGNDHAAAALMTGFVAKEVVVGSFAQSYAVAEPGDPARAGRLGERLRESFDQSSGGHGGAAALAFMVFVLAYTPCVAALAEQRRLFGWRPTASALLVQLVAAWVLAVLVFQVGARL